LVTMLIGASTAEIQSKQSTVGANRMARGSKAVFTTRWSRPSSFAGGVGVAGVARGLVDQVLEGIHPRL